ncbi:MAG: KTSC domain-containing protein [Gammaproteobacteria bacterium]|nr:KTSC domain-containing protein [Gammaproteobacteria bacterium]MBU1775549.1 KTSC domain-containing protein [Gammaproteobacteria bacterium]MBU1967599.1 KTSC domain-containing protein [Gammaproteobacteria bacterium]
MGMQKINSGKLRAAGYDPKTRILQVRFDDGSVLQHSAVGEGIWRRRREGRIRWMSCLAGNKCDAVPFDSRLILSITILLSGRSNGKQNRSWYLLFTRQ